MSGKRTDKQHKDNASRDIHLLNLLLDRHNCCVEQVADVIGDCPKRLTKVLNQEESLGLTAELAILAIHNDLHPIGEV